MYRDHVDPASTASDIEAQARAILDGIPAEHLRWRTPEDVRCRRLHHVVGPDGAYHDLVEEAIERVNASREVAARARSLAWDENILGCVEADDADMARARRKASQARRPSIRIRRVRRAPRSRATRRHAARVASTSTGGGDGDGPPGPEEPPAPSPRREHAAARSDGAS